MGRKQQSDGAVQVSVELGALTSVTSDPQVAVRAGPVVASLVNGVCDDPLLQLRLLHQMTGYRQKV